MQPERDPLETKPIERCPEGAQLHWQLEKLLPVVCDSSWLVKTPVACGEVSNLTSGEKKLIAETVADAGPFVLWLILEVPRAFLCEASK